MYWGKAEKYYYIKLAQYFVVLRRRYIIAEHLHTGCHSLKRVSTQLTADKTCHSLPYLNRQTVLITRRNENTLTPSSTNIYDNKRLFRKWSSRTPSCSACKASISPCSCHIQGLCFPYGASKWLALRNPLGVKPKKNRVFSALPQAAIFFISKPLRIKWPINISQMLAQSDMHTLWIISMACLQKQ